VFWGAGDGLSEGGLMVVCCNCHFESGLIRYKRATFTSVTASVEKHFRAESAIG